ncbi:hypothetical protein [Mesorhizobium sp. M0571]|uniref:hypothetical protein n=1 Tax=Mesorhizobium sp. M0571 TaxID=2956960 RepID=UPI003336B116
MKLTAELAELRIDIGDGAIDDYYVAVSSAAGDHRITAFTTAPSWPTSGRAKDCFAASSLRLD